MPPSAGATVGTGDKIRVKPLINPFIREAHP